MKILNGRLLRRLAKVSYSIGVICMIVGAMLSVLTIPAEATSCADGRCQDMQLNLSHIACIVGDDGKGTVEVHFVLLNVPDGVTPGTLSYDLGTISPSKDSGNVWHYTASGLPQGYYTINGASVDVNGTTVSLHNPGAYSGPYYCGYTPPQPTKTTRPPHNTPTNTPVPPTKTYTPVPPTKTNTPVPPTNTFTSVPPTNTFTSVPPTSTFTSVPPTSTNTPGNPPDEPTPTYTNTPGNPPHDPTPTNTDTPVPPTPTDTDTPVPPTPTDTDTPVPPTPTDTDTPVPPTPTETETNTPVPPTATPTALPDPIGMTILTECTDQGILWKVENPNPYPITFNYTLDGGFSASYTVYGMQTAAFLLTDNGGHTLNYSWSFEEWNFSDSANSSPQACYSPKEISTSYVCVVEGIDWKVTNPNPFPLEVFVQVDPVGSSPVPTAVVVPANTTSVVAFTSTDTHVVRVTYKFEGDEGMTSTDITNGEDHCTIVVDTPTPTPVIDQPTATSTPFIATLPPPPAPTAPAPQADAGAAPQLLIPVTGADLSQNSNPIRTVQNLFLTFGVGFIGMGLLAYGLSKKFVK